MVLRSSKVGQNASGSAILVIVVTALIVLYILFLPPADRAELLGETSGSGGSGSSGTTTPATLTLFNEKVGHIDYLNSEERDHPLPSFRVSTKVDGSVIKEVSSLYVKSSVFETVIENITFSLDEALTSDVKLSFNVDGRASGRLMMVLNGMQILNAEIPGPSSQVIVLPADDLERYNTLTIGVSSPGWAFWSMNQYALDTIQVSGDVKDISGAEARQSFILSEDEALFLDRAVLRFYADCLPREVGRLDIRVNGRTVFSGQGDCGVLNTVELDKGYLAAGQNDIIFRTDQGSYLITDLLVKVQLEEPVYPTYYFEMNGKYFTTGQDDAVCGVVDGECPEDCSEDIDKDCCFSVRSASFWCDLETAQLNDRCVSFVSSTTCDRCESAYEDSSGKVATACKGLCGDDKDNSCPSGCSPYLDKDCCFDAGDNYWCDDAPRGRPVSSVCKLGVDPDERSGCPNRYFDEDGSRLSFTATSVDDEDEELLAAYTATLELAFPNSEVKSADILVNGREIGLETRGTAWNKDISDYVRSGTNSIQIVPARSIDITSLVVKLKRSTT
jgi:hypothetical protein